MTTTNNLIEQVGGIEKAKAIVVGAPESNFPVKWGLSFKTYFRQVGYFVEQWFESKWQTRYSDSDWVDLETLSTAIAQHEQGSNSSEFKVGDLVVKTHPKNTILWPVLGVYKNGGVWLDYKGFCWKPPRVRHATPEEIKAGRRLDHSEDVTDTVTDIRNHISPRTVVWDLASGEDWSVNHG